MTFEEFQTTALTEIRRRFPDSDVSLRFVPKLQGQSYHSLSIAASGSGIAATINLFPFYSEYQEHRDMEASMEQLGSACRSVLAGTPQVDTEDLTDYEKLRHRIRFRMVPLAENREMLSGIPHRVLEDMAAVCYIELSAGPESHSGMLVTAGLLRVFGRTEEELFADAERSAPVNFPPVLKPMAEMLGLPEDEVTAQDAPRLYVAGTTDAYFGAGILLYPGFLDCAAEALGRDYYILPSSVHELILVPAQESLCADSLNSMVRDVNAAELEPEDRLSDQAYHYDPILHLLETAVDYEARHVLCNLKKGL